MRNDDVKADGTNDDDSDDHDDNDNDFLHCCRYPILQATARSSNRGWQGSIRICEQWAQARCVQWPCCRAPPYVSQWSMRTAIFFLLSRAWCTVHQPGLNGPGPLSINIFGLWPSQYFQGKHDIGFLFGHSILRVPRCDPLLSGKSSTRPPWRRSSKYPAMLRCLPARNMKNFGGQPVIWYVQ